MPETPPAPCALTPVLDEFWDRWQAQGYPISPQEWIRIESLLQQISTGGQAPAMARLRGLLCPLVARTPEAQVRFHRIWQVCYPETLPVELETSSPAPPLQPPRIPWWRQYSRTIGATMLLVLLGLAAALWWAKRPPKKPLPTPTPSATPAPKTTLPPTSKGEAPPGSMPPSPTSSPAPTTTPHPVSTPAPEVISLQANTEPVSQAAETVYFSWTLLLGLAPPLGALAWWGRRRRQQRVRQAETGGESFWPLKLPESPREIHGPDASWVFLPSDVTRGKVAALPLTVQRSTIATRRVPGQNLAAESTIEATLSAGGLPRFVHEEVVRPRNIVAVVEYVNLYDHRMPYYLSLLRRLERLGAEVQVVTVAEGSLQGFPLSVLGTAQEYPRSLGAMLQSCARAESTLLYCGDGNLFTEPRGLFGYGLTADARKLAEGWQRAALVTLTPARESEVALQGAFTVLDASWTSLERFLSPAGSASAPSPRTERRFDSHLFATDTEEAAETLYWGLPGGAYRWLCACAALPELRWDLTLDLGKALDVSSVLGPLVQTEANLKALLELPWFGGAGKLPPRLRAALEGKLPEALHERALAILVGSSPPENTWAGVAHRLEQAALEHHTGRMDAFARSVITVQEQVGENTVLKDRTLQKILRDHPTPFGWLFKDGVPLFGPRLSLILIGFLVVGGAISGLSVLLTPKNFLPSPIVRSKSVKIARSQSVKVMPERLKFGPTFKGGSLGILQNNSGQTQTLEMSITPPKGLVGYWDPEITPKQLTLEPGEKKELHLETGFITPPNIQLISATQELGTLNIRTSEGQTLQVRMTGGTENRLTVSPTSLNFGKAQQGKTQTLALTVRNSSATSLNLSTLNLSNAGGEFTLIDPPPLPLTLKPSESRTLSVRYERRQAGAHAGKLEITYKGASRNALAEGILLNGETTLLSTPTPEPMIPPTTPPRRPALAKSPLQIIGDEPIDFGSGVQGEEINREIEVRNPSATAVVDIVSVAIRGNPTNEFSVSFMISPRGVLRPGESTTVLLVYSRRSIDIHTATLQVESRLSGGADFQPIRVSVRGTTTKKGITSPISPGPTVPPIEKSPVTTTITLADAVKRARENKAPLLSAYLEKMVAIPAGSFTMGTSDERFKQLNLDEAYRDEQPAHSVSLSAYALGLTKITREMWREFIAANGGKRLMPNSGGLSVRDSDPVLVSWSACRDYCLWANTVSGMEIRLPTEAQWEYAAGGPKSTVYPWGDEENTTNRERSQFGLLGMSSDSMEWCSDWYGRYSDARASDPMGPEKGSTRVLRGFHWIGSVSDGSSIALRSAARNKESSLFQAGFRLSSPNPK